MIDLRSDTVTKPTKKMRQAMANAEVGDDVYGEDPTVNKLQQQAAERLGKQAGLFVASGTMANIVSLLTHGGRGDEVIMGNVAHTFLYEGGASAGLAGFHPQVIPNEPDGTIPLQLIKQAIRADNVHFPRTRLICLENTHNRCGGAVLSPDYCDEVGKLAHKHGISVHLDGARLFNAAIALGVPPTVLTRSVDSVMFCLSKGLGAPVGSVLCGTHDFITRAKRMRKIVGGGMRQAGIIAVAGVYALRNHIDRISVDHDNARILAQGINSMSGVACTNIGPNDSNHPQTNLVYLKVQQTQPGDRHLDARSLSNRLRNQGVLANPLGNDPTQMRMVTHLDVDEQDIDQALSALKSSLNGT